MKSLKFIIISSNSERIEKFSEIISMLFPENEIVPTSDNISLDLLKVNSPAIVFCDEKIGNSSCLDLHSQLMTSKVRERFYFIVVSEKDDFNHLRRYIDAEFDDYLIGHERTQIIYNRIRLGAKILSMKLKIKHENQILIKMSEQLEEDLNNILTLSTKFIQARLPASSDMLKEIANISVWIAEKFNQLSKQDIKDIEIASYFCQAGRLFLPDTLLKIPVMKNGRVSNPMMNQIPIVSKEIVSSISKFANVGNILYHIYENLDGSGIPDRVQNWQIPLGSRIIRAVLDFQENRYFNNLDSKATLEKLKSRINRIYDGRVINLLDEYIETKELTDHETINDIPVMLSELQDGMITAREIKANSGLKLIGENQTLTEKHISMLINHSSTDPIRGYIYIKKDSMPEINVD